MTHSFPTRRSSDLPSNLNDTVTVPNGYVAEVLFKAGDPVESGAPGYSGSFQASSETERQAGGNHDGMEYYELTGVDPNEGGLLAINRSEEHTSELQALMRISYAVFCLNKKKRKNQYKNQK